MLNDYTFFYTECPICGVFKFRTIDRQKLHAHFVVCSAIEKMYKKCVIEPNKNHTRGSERTLIDAEIARIDVELGHCSAAWVNPYFIKEEDRVFLSPEQLKGFNSQQKEQDK
jgi:hypothetical protein